MRPWLLRPPFLGSGSVRDFSDVVRVISAKSATLEPRRPGVVGLYLRMAMPTQSSARAREDVDALTGSNADDRALGVLALAEPVAGAASLALAVHGVHRGDLDAEDLLDRDLDLGLVGVGVHHERVLVVVEQAVALLTDDRGDEDVAVVLVHGAHWSSPAFFLAGAFLAGAFFAVAFLAAVFLAVAFLAGAFLAGAFLAGAFLALAFLAGAFFAAAAAFSAVAFLAGAFFAAGAFLAGAFFAAGAFSTSVTALLSVIVSTPSPARAATNAS